VACIETKGERWGGPGADRQGMSGAVVSVFLLPLRRIPVIRVSNMTGRSQPKASFGKPRLTAG
jgi:hypothetical protein